MIDLGHVAEMLGVALGGSVPVVLYIMSNKRKDRAEAEKRHQEQRALFSTLVTERKYFPSHGHNEKTGPLQAEGITYPPEER